MQAKREPTRTRGRVRVGKSGCSQLVAGGAQFPPVSSLALIRTVLRNAELVSVLAPPSPFVEDVIAGIDAARATIRSLERLVDTVAARRVNSASFPTDVAAAAAADHAVGELLTALDVPPKWLGGR